LLLLLGSRRGKISPPPEQKCRGREAHSARIRLVQWRPPPSILWSHNQAAGQVMLPPMGKHPKAHRQSIITWKSRWISKGIGVHNARKRGQEGKTNRNR
jgi:hypothetical protein